MASISSMETVTAHQTTTPPLLETDLARSRAWLDEDISESPTRSDNVKSKGKGRATVDDTGYESSVDGSRTTSASIGPDMGAGQGAVTVLDSTPKQGLTMDSDDDSDSDGQHGTGAYPPTSEQEAETRRVEETLRRWEIAERQRRKAARMSASAPPHSPTTSVAQRASSFWSSKPAGASKYPAHHRLHSQDSLDVVPPDAVSPTPPRTPTFDQNPFDVADAMSPFSDTHQTDAVMNSSADIPLTSTSHPTSPPPLTPTTNVPPKPRNPPSLDSSSNTHHADDDDEEHPRVRWWHEWLCGCKEAERRGHNQAGSTNPFE